MIQRLPRWVEIGGFWLAMIAGAVNGIGVLGFDHQAVSHLTGSSTLLGLAAVEGDTAQMIHLSLVLLSFVLGAALSGAIVENTALRLGRAYGVALMIESALLVLAMVTLVHGSTMGHFLASAACGLQNGMVSTYSGAMVRTTHVSGLFTDLGLMVGARLRGEPMNSRKAVLYLILICGFVLGGAIGALAFQRWQFESLAIPAFAAGALAVVYWIHRRTAAPKTLAGVG